MEEIIDEDVFDLSNKYVELKEKLDELSKARNTAYQEAESAKMQLIEAMVNKGMTDFTVNGVKLWLTIRNNVSQVNEKSEELREKLAELNYDVPVVIVKKDFNDVIKELIEQNDKELPEWLNEYVEKKEQVIVNQRRKRSNT